MKKTSVEISQMLLSIIKIYNPYAGLSNSHRRNVVKASFCLSAHSARVKEAQVESCEYTKTCVWVAIADLIHQIFYSPSLPFKSEGRGVDDSNVALFYDFLKLFKNILTSSGQGSFV